jgi:translation initiation factor IF-1
MPKIRGVKPDYWTDEDIVELSIPARLLFIGLWNYACDNGHVQDKPKQLKMRILPGDDVNVTELLRELSEKGCIERDSGWIYIPNLTRHQKPDRRYFTTCEREDCEEPEATVSQRESRRVHAVHTSGAQRAHTVRTPGALGDGEVMVKGSDGDGESEPAGKPRAKRATQLPDTWRPNDQHTDFAAKNGLNAARELAQFTDHHRARGTTFKDWDAAFRTWLRRAVEYGRGGRPLVVVTDAPVDETDLPPAEQSWMRRRPRTQP